MLLMLTSTSLLVLLAPLAFVAVAVAATASPGSNPRRVIQLGAIASWLGVGVAVAAGIATAVKGLIESPTWGVSGLGFSIRLDALSTVMLIMITLLAVVIFRYSCNYLDGDDRHGAFLGRLAATIASVQVLVIAGNTALLVAAWIATSFALHQLLLFYKDRRAAVVAGRKKFIVARIGDVFLIAAAVGLHRHFGTGNLQVIFDSAKAATPGWGFGTVELSAVCLAIAAILKSAQFPTHGWLVEVMETPTPVSALLHAGILNAGPFLAIRMALVTDTAHVATTMLIVIGGFTALFASVVLLTQPSIKVALGYSSAAHMGFMLMVCGMGIYPAALLHLVAHSFYKAHAFLSSGSVIDDARADKVAVPKRLGSPARVLGSMVIALAIYLGLAAAFGVNLADEPMLLAVGLILVLGTTQIVAPALDSTGTANGTARAAGMAFGVTLSFFSLEAGAHALLLNTVPDGGVRTALHSALMVVVVLSFAAVVLLQILEPAHGTSSRRRALAVHLRSGLYANAAFDRLVGALRTPSTRVEAGR